MYRLWTLRADVFRQQGGQGVAEEAITLNEYLQVDPEKCTGCGICAEKCPKKVIRIREDLAVMCDTCEGDPTCVKVCPQHALRFE